MKRLLKMLSSHVFDALLDLMTETVVQVGYLNESHEVVLAVFRKEDVLGEIVPSLKCSDQ